MTNPQQWAQSHGPSNRSLCLSDPPLLRGNPSLPPARIRSRKTAMKWKTPVIIEIAVGLEINAYACAEIK
jgi:coenzyme PQQ precursor peptide PqqA